MPNEQEQQSTQQVDNQNEEFVEPQDLSQAFETLREVKQIPAETPVEQPAAEPEPQPEQQQSVGYEGYQQPSAHVYNGAGGEPDYTAAGDSGFDSGYDDVNYQVIAKQMVDEATRMAAEQTNEFFRENGIKKLTIKDIYNKNEETGEVTFENPDNASRPFATRQEAQAWCDAINKSIDDEWRRQANINRNEFVKQIVPSLNMLAFAPEFYSMTPSEQRIFDKLVKRFEVLDQNNKVIGYNCDLREWAQEARNIAADESLWGVQQQAVQQQAPSGPAVDMKSSSSQGQPTPEITDPKDLSEAMKMLRQKK